MDRDATPAPWEWCGTILRRGPGGKRVIWPATPLSGGLPEIIGAAEDFAFVSASRQAVPALLAEIDLLRSQVADLWDDGGGRAYLLGRAAQAQLFLDWLVQERDLALRELERLPGDWGPGTEAGDVRARVNALAYVIRSLEWRLEENGTSPAALPRPDALAEENRRLHGALKNLADACAALPGTASLSSVRSRTNHALAQARAVLAAPAREKAPG
jgi:hypothetical protein